ncbi:MAG: phosphotransferase [Pirellulales bacterium]|nr:phosphotransferase [Pirellulales bacterium]
MRPKAEPVWLDAGDAAGVARFLRERGWIEPDEVVLEVGRAGDGNMNLTLRVRTGQRSLILKQARPWVEKYPHIAAPAERMEYEERFYQRASDIVEVARRMPRLLASDVAAGAIALEDIADAHDASDLYRGATMGREQVDELAFYLAALHGATYGATGEARFANRAMRALNQEHIYRLPLAADNGLDLELFEPGLNAAASELKRDVEFGRLARLTGERYLADGPCLAHGDFFPGSWLMAPRGLFVIDAEFCFLGPVEFDLACAIAHLALARQPIDLPERLLDQYCRRSAERLAPDGVWLARFAACEVMRRLIGVAQLPIPPSDGFRAALLGRSRDALLNNDWRRLWDHA